MKRNVLINFCVFDEDNKIRKSVIRQDDNGSARRGIPEIFISQRIGP